MYRPCAQPLGLDYPNTMDSLGLWDGPQSKDASPGDPPLDNAIGVDCANPQDIFSPNAIVPQAGQDNLQAGEYTEAHMDGQLFGEMMVQKGSGSTNQPADYLSRAEEDLYLDGTSIFSSHMQSSEPSESRQIAIQKMQLELYKTKTQQRLLELKELGIRKEEDKDYLRWHGLELELELTLLTQRETSSVYRDTNADDGNSKATESLLNTELAAHMNSLGAYVSGYQQDNLFHGFGLPSQGLTHELHPNHVESFLSNEALDCRPDVNADGAAISRGGSTSEVATRLMASSSADRAGESSVSTWESMSRQSSAATSVEVGERVNAECVTAQAADLLAKTQLQPQRVSAIPEGGAKGLVQFTPIGRLSQAGTLPFHDCLQTFGVKKSSRRPASDLERQRRKDVREAGGQCVRCQLRGFNCSGGDPCVNCESYLKEGVQQLADLRFDACVRLTFCDKNIFQAGAEPLTTKGAGKALTLVRAGVHMMKHFFKGSKSSSSRRMSDSQAVLNRFFHNFYDQMATAIELEYMDTLSRLHSRGIRDSWYHETCNKRVRLLAANSGWNLFIKTNTVLEGFKSSFELRTAIKRERRYLRQMRAYTSIDAFNILEQVIRPSTLRNASLTQVAKVIVFTASLYEQVLLVRDHSLRETSDMLKALDSSLLNLLRYLIAKTFSGESALLRHLDLFSTPNIGYALDKVFWKALSAELAKFSAPQSRRLGHGETKSSQKRRREESLLATEQNLPALESSTHVDTVIVPPTIPSIGPFQDEDDPESTTVNRAQAANTGEGIVWDRDATSPIPGQKRSSGKRKSNKMENWKRKEPKLEGITSAKATGHSLRKATAQFFGSAQEEVPFDHLEYYAGVNEGFLFDEDGT